MEPIRIDRLIRSRRRSVALIVTARAELLVRAPWRTPLAEIETFVREKASWIRRKQDQVRSMPSPAARRFENGETFFYLGRPVSLEWAAGVPRGGQLGETLQLDERLKARAPRALEAWYRREAERVLAARCAVHAVAVGRTPTGIRITGARRRWGSCSRGGRLCFSWRLIQVPLEAVDYVVVHELVHLLHPNHSRSFWLAVGRVLPDWKERQRRLRGEASLLDWPEPER